MKAIWNDQVIAESDQTLVVEGNHYFPPDSVKRAYLLPSDHHSTCPWKGEASYFHVEVDGFHSSNGAWYYPNPKPAAAQIKGYIAFWRGVKVIV